MKKKQLDNILFLDIETVSQYKDFSEMDDMSQKLWKKKSATLARFKSNESEESVDFDYRQKAGIYAEFGKIICITVGYLKLDNPFEFRIKSFSGHDEKQILQDFGQLLDKHFNNPKKDYLCGHNIKEFDIPYICRKLLMHGLPFPELLNISGKKPWEIDYLLDTMQMWKFGDYKHFSSLNLLTHIHGISSPKDDIDGSQVCGVYYDEEEGLQRITRYCEKDVLAVCQLFVKWQGFNIKGWEIVNTT